MFLWRVYIYECVFVYVTFLLSFQPLEESIYYYTIMNFGCSCGLWTDRTKQNWNDLFFLWEGKKKEQREREIEMCLWIRHAWIPFTYISIIPTYDYQNIEQKFKYFKNKWNIKVIICTQLDQNDNNKIPLAWWIKMIPNANVYYLT